jgi:dipeptidyl aminopeptidase/acylaminoacyl peptidase
MDWLPNGQQIAVIGRTNWYGYKEIYLISPNRDTQERLTFIRNHPICVSWSGNGEWLGFSTESDIYRYEFNPSRIKKLTNTLDMRGLCLDYASQNDEIIIAGDRSVLWVMNGDGSSLRPLAEDLGGYIGGVENSPDGTTMALQIWENNNSDILVLNTYLHRKLWLTRGPEDDSHPSWSPDGDWLVFMRGTRDAFGDICIVRSDGYGLTVIKPGDEYQISPIWSPLPALEIGQEFSVTELGSGLQLRVGANTKEAVLATLEHEEKIAVLDGPVENESYLWWYVRVLGSGEQGWVIDTPGWWQSAK